MHTTFAPPPYISTTGQAAHCADRSTLFFDRLAARSLTGSVWSVVCVHALSERWLFPTLPPLQSCPCLPCHGLLSVPSCTATSQYLSVRPVRLLATSVGVCPLSLLSDNLEQSPTPPPMSSPSTARQTRLCVALAKQVTSLS